MDHEITEFRWHTSLDGHYWIETEELDLSAKMLRKPSLRRPRGEYIAEWPESRARSYDPFKSDPGLFRTFAELTPDRIDIKAFADKYGLLGGKKTKRLIDPELGDRQLLPAPSGDLLQDWSDEIWRMRQVVALWDAVCREDMEMLSRFIYWNDDESVLLYRSDPIFEVESFPNHTRTLSHVASKSELETLFSAFQSSERIRPTRHHLQTTINQQLHGNVSARLLWSNDFTQQQVFFVPIGLLAAMWLQFAFSIESGNKFRQCEQCGKWIEIARGKGRPDKRFCSDVCRTSAQRKRRTIAQRKAAEGLPVSMIAKDLGVTTRQVRSWLKSGGKSSEGSTPELPKGR